MRGNLLWIGYVLGGVMFLLGLAILTGYLNVQTAEGTGGPLQTVFGTVMMLYGVYRFVLTIMQRRKAEREGG